VQAPQLPHDEEQEEDHGEARVRGAHALLPKPYRAQTLLTAVAESLDPDRVETA